MNNQHGKGITWTDYTWNPIAGCFHDCQWRMPDGNLAVCYAGSVAENVATSAYPDGFRHYYWKPKQLKAPTGIKKPSRIFVGSMADVFGHWVPSEDIQQILDVCAAYPQHSFQFLTKAPKRLKMFDFPANCWVGISAPPTFMNGLELKVNVQRRWLYNACEALGNCNARIKWLSAEPLSFDLSHIFEHLIFDWLVIGAASRGRVYYQPEPEWVHNLTDEAHDYQRPVFYKGNLHGNAGAVPWLEEFPR